MTGLRKKVLFETTEIFRTTTIGHCHEPENLLSIFIFKRRCYAQLRVLRDCPTEMFRDCQIYLMNPAAQCPVLAANLDMLQVSYSSVMRSLTLQISPEFKKTITGSKNLGA